MIMDINERSTKITEETESQIQEYKESMGIKLFKPKLRVHCNRIIKTHMGLPDEDVVRKEEKPDYIPEVKSNDVKQNRAAKTTTDDSIF